MKSTICLCILLSGLNAFAFGTTTPESVVKKLLDSNELRSLKAKLKGYSLSQINVAAIDSHQNSFQVSVKYVVPNSETTCVISGRVDYSVMESVGPGGSGWRTREFYSPLLTAGEECPK